MPGRNKCAKRCVGKASVTEPGYPANVFDLKNTSKARSDEAYRAVSIMRLILTPINC